MIKRIREERVYYVFPGGGIEKGETPEQATIREAYEELGVTIKIKECFQKVHYNGIQYYFISEVISGQFGSGHGEEFTDLTRNRGVYQPMWIDLDDLLSLDIRPIEVAKRIHVLFS